MALFAFRCKNHISHGYVWLHGRGPWTISMNRNKTEQQWRGKSLYSQAVWAKSLDLVYSSSLTLSNIEFSHRYQFDFRELIFRCRRNFTTSPIGNPIYVFSLSVYMLVCKDVRTFFLSFDIKNWIMSISRLRRSAGEFVSTV